MKFFCQSCEATLQPGPSRALPERLSCPVCAGRMESEADVVELHGDRLATRPYDLDELKARLAEEHHAAAPQGGPVWFAGVDGHSVGPLTLQGLEGLRARGHLQRATLVWREGWPVWAAAEAVPELRDLLGLPAAPEPPGLPS